MKYLILMLALFAGCTDPRYVENHPPKLPCDLEVVRQFYICPSCGKEFDANSIEAVELKSVHVITQKVK